MPSFLNWWYKLLPSLSKRMRATTPSSSISEEILIKNMLALEQTSVDDVMTPRGDIVWIDMETPLPRIVERVSGIKSQDVVVCEGKLDHVVGVITLVDILKAMQVPSAFSLKTYLKEPLFVAPSVPCTHAFLQMVQHKTSLALVLDEYGALDGVVTIDHLVEVMVDTIQSVGDPFEARLMEEKEDGSWVVDGRLPLDEIEDLFKVKLAEEDVATVGGLVLQMAEHVPLRGALFQHSSGLNLQVVEADPRKVKRVHIARRP